MLILIKNFELEDRGIVASRFQYLRQNSEDEEIGRSVVELWSLTPTTQNHGCAHDRHIITATMPPAGDRGENNEAIEQNHPGNVSDERASDNVGNISLGRGWG